MSQDPLTRLNLPRERPFSAPPEITAAEPPDFPETAGPEPPSPTGANAETMAVHGATDPDPDPPPADLPSAPTLSALERYRLEQDREHLRALAYRRHFLNQKG